ncbi:hypothetical protein COCNU_10G001410 [Cocos nucifera]|uniref:Uncharacterized protein n=1 Tax=Cocos nucifera TaxID=13894 RepID=A0A8K0ILK2_COCNU|nr:hypothetical protein COCNU_10G001410 [Cocos nucifera]
MDKEKGRDLKRSGSSAGRSSPAKRQQRALSERINGSTNPISASSSSPSVLNGSSYGRGGGGGGGESAMERWKKERAKAFVWGSRINREDGRTGDGGGSCGSDGRGSHLSRPPLFTSGRLRSKESEDCNAVDHPMVPRKLRSAMNKRSSLSASPPLQDSKNKCHASNGSHIPCVNGSRRVKRNMLKEQITKDEEEAAEILSALASMIPDGRPIKISQEGRTLEENSETTATAFSRSEASKEESTKILLPSASFAVTNPSSHIEKSFVETAKPEPSVLEQPAITCVNQRLHPGSNGAAHSDFQRTPPSKNEQANDAISRDSLISSNLLDAPLYSYSGNKSAHLDALSVSKSEINLWPFESTSSETQVQAFNQKTDNATHYMNGKDTDHALWPGLPSSDDGHLTMLSSTKAATWRDPAAGGCRTSSNGLSSNGSGLLTEKVDNDPLGIGKESADGRSSWKRCTTHVYISHIIQSYQNTEKKHRFLPLTDQSKAKEGANSGVQASNEATGLSSLNSMTNAGTSGSIMETTSEATIQMLSGSYTQQQQGTYHSLMPLPFSRGSRSSPSLDQLAATTAQQLQLPYRIGNSFYGPYGPQMVPSRCTTKHQQQQQIWQVQMAQYRPPLGIPTWQTMSMQDASLLPCAQPPSIFSQLSREMQVRPHKSPSSQQLRQLLPVPSSSSSLRAKNPNGGGFATEGAPQLQLLCNAQRM